MKVVVQVLLVLGLVGSLAMGVRAQEATPKDELATLQAQVKALQSQLAANKPPAPTPAQQIESAQKMMAALFKTIKDQSYEPCRSVGGTLTINVSQNPKDGIVTTSLTCALK